MRTYLGLIAAVVCLLVVPQAAGAAVVTVHVFNMDFSTNPASGPVVDPTIKVGDTIRWLFDDSGHTTTSVRGTPEQWNSSFVNRGSSFSHTFTNVGSFEYYCSSHGFDQGNGHASGMAGVIRVQPVPEPAGLAALAAAGLVLRRPRRSR